MRSRFILLLSLTSLWFIACGKKDFPAQPIAPPAVSIPQPDPDPDPDPKPKEGVLIYGVRWATSNVDKPGTFAAKPEYAGMLYQWGRNVGWSATGTLLSSDSEMEWIDTQMLGDVWPAFKNPCPKGWHIPTIGEFMSLSVNAISEWIKSGDVDGMRFYDKESGESIFIPAPGHRDENGEAVQYIDNEEQQYWSSDVSWNYSRLEYEPRTFYFKKTVCSTTYHSNRVFGMPIRCVADEK